MEHRNVHGCGRCRCLYYDHIPGELQLITYTYFTNTKFVPNYKTFWFLDALLLQCI